MHVMAAEQETQRPLLTPDECLRLPAAVKTPDGKSILEPGDMLVLPAGSNPIYGKQILYFKDPVFDGRSKIRAPRESDRLRVRDKAPARPVPCDPALAAVQVERPKSELDDMIPAEPEGAPALPAANPAAAPVAAPAAAAAVVAAAAVATAAAAVAAPVAEEKQSVYTAPIPAPAPAAPAVEYTPEELAALDAEADETEVDVEGGDAAVEAAMRAEAADADQEATPAPAPAADPSTNAGDDLLNFDV
jgi:type IV secretion system protein VirD4